MNDKITIQKPQAGKDAAGQPTAGWDDLAEVWADIRFQSGAEAIRSDLATSVVKASVMVRSRSDVDNTMRIVDKRTGTAYRIQSVLPNSKDRRFMFLVCESAK